MQSAVIERESQLEAQEGKPQLELVQSHQETPQFVTVHGKQIKIQPFHIKFREHGVVDADHLIEILRDLRVTKDMAKFNIERYGYQHEMDYILQSLGYKVGANSKKPKRNSAKKPVDDRISFLTGMFEYIFDTERDCFVRIFNKKTESYWMVPVRHLKNERKLKFLLKSDLCKDNKDIMFSLSTYNTMKRAETGDIFSLHLLAVDVDYDEVPKYQEMPAESILGLLETEFGTSIPIPSKVEYGHRIRLWFKLESVGATPKSIGLADKITKEIGKRLKHYGAKGQSLTTYARFPGSINSRDGSKIQIKEYRSEPYQLSELKWMLPEPKKKRFRERKDVRVTNKPDTNVARVYHVDYDYNKKRLRDLERIQRIRDEKGYRELLCFHYRNHCILAGMTEEEAFEATRRFNQGFSRPLNERKLHWDTRNVERKQYTYKSETLLEELGITYEEEHELRLEAIFSVEMSRRRDNERNKRNYRKKIDKPKKDKSLAEAQKIRDLLTEGLKRKEICSALGLTLKQYTLRCKALKEQGLLK